jgi:hypothetical protein
MYPTPSLWGSCSDSGTSSSSVVLHFEDAFSLWSFNVETSQADARLLGHLGAVNQVSVSSKNHAGLTACLFQCLVSSKYCCIGAALVLVSYYCEDSDSSSSYCSILQAALLLLLLL